jgi:hypothetical protein
MGNQMTKDDILSMAKEAGIGILYEYNGPDHAGVCDWKDIERFAALVAEKATEQANARQNASWARMCEKMVAAEREACAKVCENWTQPPEATGMELALCAAAIRARGIK